MELSYQVLNVLVFLAPGFLSQVIFEAAVYREKKEIPNKIIESLIYSLIIYFLASVFAKTSPVILTQTTIQDQTQYGIEIASQTIFVVLSLSVLIPLALAYLITTDLIHAALRKIRITIRTSRANTWIDVLYSVRSPVIVNLKDGRRVFGWVGFYSNTAEEGKLYLHNPSWVIEENNQIKYVELNIKGLFLVEPNGIEFIEFLNEEVKDEAGKQPEQAGNQA
jgi:hypothetical protein